jgi:hypothetical protein
VTLPDEPCCHTPPLHLVLPSRLTPYEVLWQMAEAVTAAHARFLATARALRR